MLIINADDFGRDTAATDNSLVCYKQGLITSASAMVFMADSQRAAESAISLGLETGLHLNLTQPLDGPRISPQLMEHHLPIINYFRRGKWSHVIYNPFLRRKLDYVFNAQYEEYFRLFKGTPAKIDGHHHKHLCMNMMAGRIIPQGFWVRRTFSSAPGEKDIIGRLYSYLVDAWLIRHYRCVDLFFSIESLLAAGQLEKMVCFANSVNVELMTHPSRAETFKFMMGLPYQHLISSLPKGTYRMLSQILR